MKRHKYGAKKCACNSGHIHHSRLEAGHCNIIMTIKNYHGKKIVSVKTQKQFDHYVDGVRLFCHKPDFFLTFEDGSQMVIESKGFATKEWLRKKKQFEALYPNIKYEVWTK